MMDILTGLTLEELEAKAATLGLERWRAKAILAWLYRRGAESFEAMTDLSPSTRARLSGALACRSTAPVARQVSPDGTIKFLIRLSDGNAVETVLIPEAARPAARGTSSPAGTGPARSTARPAARGTSSVGSPSAADTPSPEKIGPARSPARIGPARSAARRTICLSTQVGCPIRCVFCASGLNGLTRNLTAAEIVEQVLHVRRATEPVPSLPARECRRTRVLRPTERPISNLVIMGIGEPLLNYDHLSRALLIMNAPWGLGIGYHRITLSTVGIVTRLEALVAAGLTPNLALSLHAPNDRIRRQVVPTLPNVRVAQIVEAGRAYKQRTRKQVTYEYVLLEGINDAPDHAAQLAQLVRGSELKVNVIPWNRVEELPYRAPSAARVASFTSILKRAGVQVTVRKRKGDDVAAACGQLRARADGDRAGPILAGDRAGPIFSGEGVSAADGLPTEEVPRAAGRAAVPLRP